MSTHKGKAGRIGKKHRDYILNNWRDKTPDELARDIEKNVESVKKVMAQLGIQYKTRDDRREFASADIRNSPYWKQLKSELTADELDLFIEHWKETMSQFKDDILHTEKIQVMDLIKTEILMGRDLRAEKLHLDLMHSYGKQIEDVRNDISLTDKEREDKLAFLYEKYGYEAQLQGEHRKSYQGLLKEKKSLVSQVKGSRDQRLERIENSKETIQSWIIQLMSDTETRRKIGEEMEKMRLAMDVEYERLTEWHKFADGELDVAILNSEVVERYNDDLHSGISEKTD